MDPEVLIVGAGPVGLMLACELRLWGVRVVVAEALERPTGLSKALGIQARGVDLLALRGLLERFAEGAPSLSARAHFARIPLDVSRLEVPPRFLFIQQARVEALLLERAAELGVEVRRGLAFESLTQDADGVTARFGDGSTVRAPYLVGCDGGRSRVRESAGIAFPGEPPSLLLRLGDVRLEIESSGPEGVVFKGGARAPFGVVLPLGDGWHRVISSEPYPPGFDRDAPMTLDELRASVERTQRVTLPMTEARWLSRFTDSSRQAAEYQRGRVFVAGDAAHTHLPAGGPGLSTGLNDAANLGWKLAAAVQGWAGPELLASYHLERHPVGERVLLHTRAQAALMVPTPQVTALRQVLAELFRQPAAVAHVVDMLQGTDMVHDLGPGEHVGRWLPDCGVTLPTGRGALVDFTGAWRERGRGYEGRMDVVRAKSELPLDALLVRPDGLVAWSAGPATPAEGLEGALRRWFGPAASET